ncbi:MAG: hypothetical protein ACYTKD_15390, partial [Planctomycetota bacterium]
MFATILLVLGLAGCGAYDPSAEPGSLKHMRYRFGRVGTGVVGHASFFGEVGGLSSGAGVVIDFPPLVPVNSAVCILGTAVVTAPFWIIEGGHRVLGWGRYTARHPVERRVIVRWERGHEEPLVLGT